MRRHKSREPDRGYQPGPRHPQYAPPGTWAVKCYVYDNAGNFGTYITTIDIG